MATRRPALCLSGRLQGTTKPNCGTRLRWEVRLSILRAARSSVVGSHRAQRCPSTQGRGTWAQWDGPGLAGGSEGFFLTLMTL